MKSDEEDDIKYLDKEINPEVPPETALKWALVENGKLKAEIDFLEHELEKKNAAIKKFKQWQKDMTSFNAVKWLEEGIRLVAQDDAELRKKFKVLKNFIKRTERYKSFEESFQRAYDDYCANKEAYDLVFEEDEEEKEENN
jgi:hypothetical protein